MNKTQEKQTLIQKCEIWFFGSKFAEIVQKLRRQDSFGRYQSKYQNFNQKIVRYYWLEILKTTFEKQF